MSFFVEAGFNKQALLYVALNIRQQGTFWRRYIYFSVGEVHQEYHDIMAVDLLVSFMKAGARFRHILKFFSCFRAHEGSKTIGINTAAVIK